MSKIVLKEQNIENIHKGRNGMTSVNFNGKIYILGGRLSTRNQLAGIKGRKYSKDIIEFELDEEKSIVKSVNIIPTRNSEFFSGVYCHASVLYEEKILTFFGSASNGYLPKESVIEFDFNNREFREIRTNNPPKTSRHGHSAVLYNSKCYIFGGHYTEFQNKPSIRTFFSDVISYDIDSETWNKCKSRGDKPSKRSWHSCSLFGEGQMLIFGGFYMRGKEEIYYNDTYVFCLNTFIWTKLKDIGFDGNSENIPRVRNRSSLTKIGRNSFVLFGGNYYDGKKDKWYDDIFGVQIDLDKKEARWRKLEFFEQPKFIFRTSHHIHQRIGNRIMFWGGEVNIDRPTHITYLDFKK